MTSNASRSLGLAALVVGMALFGSVAFAGSAAAASDGSIGADPADPGATSTHTVTLTVGSAATGSWNGFAIDYTDTDGDASNVGSRDVVKVGIDRDDDGAGDTIDESVSDDFYGATASNDGKTIGLGFGGSYSLAEGDEVVVVVEDVVNPSEGDHEIGLAINPQSSGGTGTATLSIGSEDRGSETTTESATDTTTTDSDADTTDAGTSTTDSGADTTESGATTDTTVSDGDGADTTESDDDDPETTASGGTPGFGVAAALVALLAAGVLALRRE